MKVFPNDFLKKLPYFMILLFFFDKIQSQFVYNQLAISLPFDLSSPQVILQANFDDTQSTNQYTLTGWFKPSVNIISISNILQIQNVAAGLQTDLLFINFVFNGFNSSLGSNTYSLVFLNQVGINTATGNSDMIATGFSNIPLNNSTWIYFGISCDYIGGKLSIYLQPSSTTTPLTGTFSINYPSFSLNAGFNLVIASVMNNTYFVSTSGFTGNIAYIDLGVFYTTNFQNIWMSFMTVDAYNFFGVICDLNFNIYSGTSGGTIKSTGANTFGYSLNGTYSSQFLIDKSTIGVDFGAFGYVNLGNLDFQSKEGIFSLILYFQFKFAEPLPNSYILFERGIPGTNGFLQISLNQQSGNVRVLQLTVRGLSTGNWQSLTTFAPGVMHRIISGIVVNPNGCVYNVFYDVQSGTSNYQLLLTNDQFSSSPQQSYLLSSKNNVSGSNGGKFTMIRFAALNSASSALKNTIAASLVFSNSTATQQFNSCLVPTSFFGDNKGCLVGNKKMIAADTRQITEFCPYGFKNATTDTCIPCLTPDCSEISTSQILISPLTDNSFRVQNSIPLADYNQFVKNVQVSLNGVGSSTVYKHTINPNIAGQFSDIIFDIQGDASNSMVNITLPNTTSPPIFDQNGNLMYQNTASIRFSTFCILSPSLKTSMNALSYIIVVLFFITLGFILLLTIFCQKRIKDLSGLWKFFLHNCIKAQFICFLVLLNLNMPCCVREFLNILYYFFVSWDHAFGHSINNLEKDSTAYQTGYISNSIPKQFTQVGAYNFLLHNMMVIFIIHLLIFVIYISLKIFDCLKFQKNRFFYRLFVFIEYSFMIAGYGFVILHASTFSFLNFRLSVWNHSYFVASFLISLFYLIVFIVFTGYAFYRLLIAKSYLVDPILFNALFYYFAGYKKRVLLRTYDIWFYIVYFISGFALGGLFDYYLAQIITILVFHLILFVLSLYLRPWRYFVQMIYELFCQLLLILILILFLVVIAYDVKGCSTCIDREGVYCKILVALMFIYLFIVFVYFLIQGLLMATIGSKFEKIGHSASELVQLAREETHNGVSMTNQKLIESKNGNESNNPLLIAEFNHFQNETKMINPDLHRSKILTSNYIEFGGNNNQLKPDLVYYENKINGLPQNERLEDKSIENFLKNVTVERDDLRTHEDENNNNNIENIKHLYVQNIVKKDHINEHPFPNSGVLNMNSNETKLKMTDIKEQHIYNLTRDNIDDDNITPVFTPDFGKNNLPAIKQSIKTNFNDNAVLRESEKEKRSKSYGINPILKQNFENTYFQKNLEKISENKNFETFSKNSPFYSKNDNSENGTLKHEFDQRISNDSLKHNLGGEYKINSVDDYDVKNMKSTKWINANTDFQNQNVEHGNMPWIHNSSDYSLRDNKERIHKLIIGDQFSENRFEDSNGSNLKNFVEDYNKRNQVNVDLFGSKIQEKGFQQ